MTMRTSPAGASPAGVSASAQEMTFGPLTISFDHRVLRPRPWTAAQSRWAIELDPALPPGPVLELCSGAGQIGLMAAHGSDRPAVLVDQDHIACGFARHNAVRAGVRADVRCSSLSEALAPTELFPLILADPPWVPTRTTPDFPEDPLTAIDGGADGLQVARDCLHVIALHLAESGSALLQLGSPSQADTLRAETPSHRLQVTAQRDFGTSGVVIQLTHLDPDRASPAIRSSRLPISPTGFTADPAGA